ncbi:TIM-barrel domain-containing protein [Galbibacter sp. PAP.153]|uniref:TIM-barrel domain-containing protein n=1 Tax=Galbibacter sp. PAP.153 TaxID=3104623 RepID=UPI0030084CC0
MKINNISNSYFIFLFTFLFIFLTTTVKAQEPSVKGAVSGRSDSIVHASQVDSTTVEVFFSAGQKMIFDFYGDHIFRLFQDNSNKGMRPPSAEPQADILVDHPRKKIEKLQLSQTDHSVLITTGAIAVSLDKATALIKVRNLKAGADVIEFLAPVSFEKNRTRLTLKEHEDEYFYGGGVQNGRFSHKGKRILIENQNSWTDGGVASPNPYYWSSRGYGMMWNTFKKGTYDFGAEQSGMVKLSHQTPYLDVFFMIDHGAKDLLNDFYQLTGNPVLLPKFGFYQGHLNAYNRDYWRTAGEGVLFEDGKYYQESQKDNGGIKESLNGEKDNYQFSARAVIDRYKNNDMPLGWILPNDGYGAGYGQTKTLEGNIQNLKELGVYARNNGVEIGLWTQSDLHPKKGVSALLQRDIVKEVRDAGVRVLKTDVAWVGQGYSFGLNGVADVGEIMPEYGNDARPFIISLDGWAGTQRYAGVWSGDQTGGVWEYIRFHVPTYIGSGLSGQPNITSDMDGIFGGGNPIVNTRDFQWKTFTPMQLNMDGWGTNEKYPQAMGEPAASINRNYLKLKSELIPYTYSIAKEATDGLPMIRAMFLKEKNAYTQGIPTQYQFMYGPSFLVAPIYKETDPDTHGNDVRHGIYLPKGLWVDYFTGQQYQGGQIINSFDSPLWKLPVFVERGAIIPEANPHNNVSEIDAGLRTYEVYPYQGSSFTVYDDDGTTEAYKNGAGLYTKITSTADEKGNAKLVVYPALGDFKGLVNKKLTAFKINTTDRPTAISAQINGKHIALKEAGTREGYENGTNVYYYDRRPDLNRFSTKGSEFEQVEMVKNPQLLVRIEASDITKDTIGLHVQGYKFRPENKDRVSSGLLTAPGNVRLSDKNITAYTLKPVWDKVTHADYYEIDFQHMRYTTIKDTAYLFENLRAETHYRFKLRAVNKDGVSPWRTFEAETKSNPLEFAIQGISGTTNVYNQEGYEIANFFDFDQGNMWHTLWGEKSVPFEIVMDLRSFNQLDKFQYLARSSGGNGVFRQGKVYYGNDGNNWQPAGTFQWNGRDDQTFVFTGHPTARFIKIVVTEGVGGYGSGRELYVFKVPGSESYLPGDINNDGLIDENDLTSYHNYTGLRQGDADFEGYVSRGDVNKNGRIDAYDISVVATQLQGGVQQGQLEKVSGRLHLSTPKKDYKKGALIEVTVRGSDLKSVNALSMAIPFHTRDYEFVRVTPLAMGQMDNFTNERLHSNGDTVLYPTFVNIGNQRTITGDRALFVLIFKAKHSLRFDLSPGQGILVDKNLNIIDF